MDVYLKEVLKEVNAALAHEGKKADAGADFELYGEDGLNSMMVADVAFALEERFGIEIPDSVFRSDMTAADLADQLRQIQSNNQTP